MKQKEHQNMKKKKYSIELNFIFLCRLGKITFSFAEISKQCNATAFTDRLTQKLLMPFPKKTF